MTETNKKLGIDLIKRGMKSLYDLGEEIYDAKKDIGKIDKLELIGLGDNIISIGSQALHVNAIIEQAKDIDSDEAKELVAYGMSLGISNEDVQALINHTVHFIQGQFDLYNEDVRPAIEIIKKLKNKTD